MTNLRKTEAQWQRIRTQRAARIAARGFANRTDARKRGARKGSQ